MAKSASMSKEQLTDQIRETLKPLIERFANQKSQRTAEHEKQIEEIEKLRKNLDPDSPAIKSLEAAISSLEADPGNDRRERLEDATFAVIAAGNDLGLRLQFRKRRGRGAARGGTRKPRMSAADSADMADKVYAVLPPSNTKNENCISKEQIASKSGVDASNLQSVLLRLKREGRAESNGKRGLAGGWRRAAS